nr:MAG TPA: hypothetical protein [Caudoviricetes sp.]
MIEITKIKTYGWEEAIRGMRNSYNSWDKSDSGWYLTGTPGTNPAAANDKYLREKYCIGDNDYTLMKRLVAAGSDHCKFLRMITVSMDINAPLYLWKEFDTYKVGTVANSCSTMHKIAEKEFTLEDFSHEHLVSGWVGKDKNGIAISIPGPYEKLQSTIELLNNVREMYLYVLKTPKEKIDWSCTPSLSAKDIWWQIIQLLPNSYNQRRTVMLNYEVLANIYKSRKNHKLDEWQMFCKTMESTLPYPELFTTRK